MPQLFTMKAGRYPGPGDPLSHAILDEHAPANSPFKYMPALPHIAAIQRDVMYKDYVQPYSVGEFTSTIVGAGGTIARSADGLLFTNDAADNDLAQLQLLDAYTPAANKRASCYARLKASDATQSDLYFGFASTDTSIVAGEPARSAIFKKDDGDTIINGRTNDNGTGTETANLITNFTADTYYDLGVTILPTSATAGTVLFHYKLASSNTWAQVAKTTDFPDAALRLTFLIQNGEAVAKTMTVNKWVVFWEN